MVQFIKVGLDVFRDLLANEQHQSSQGFMQRLDARVKLLGLTSLIVLTVLSQSTVVQLSVLLVCYILSYLSGISLSRLASRSLVIIIPAFIIALPRAILSFNTFSVNALGFQPFSNGLSFLLIFILRIAAASTALVLLISSTGFSKILSCLRWFKVPKLLLWIMAMTHRYLILLASELHRLALARESRMHRDPSIHEVWREGGRMLASFLMRSIERGKRVQMATLSRNGGTSLKFYYPDFRVGLEEWLFVALIAVLIFFGMVMNI